MEKPAITSYKSHMSCAEGLAARSPNDSGGSQAGPPRRGAEAGDDSGSDASGSTSCRRLPVTATVTSWAFMAACRVDTSARCKPGAADRPDGTARGSIARQEEHPMPAGTADLADGMTPAVTACRPTLTRGGGIPRPVRGAQRGARQAASAANDRQLGKGQGAYFPADGTVVQSAVRVPRLSRGESRTYALDLQSATLCNLAYTKSNIFEFVMT